MQNGKIKVTAVSYLNTKPFLYGLFKSPIADQIQLQLDIPSVCADKLLQGEAHLGLVPVAVLPKLKQYQLVSDYCIGCHGPVQTVCVYADKSIQELDSIYLDYQSRTSVQLLKLLLREHWGLNPALIDAKSGFESRIGGNTGALVIGDRCIDLENRHTFQYDLGEHWHRHTGLPFVFAAWVATKTLDPAFEAAFNAALRNGIEDIPQLVYILPQPTNHFDLKKYLTHYIQYQLDSSKRLALKRFLETLAPTQSQIPS